MAQISGRRHWSPPVIAIAIGSLAIVAAVVAVALYHPSSHRQSISPIKPLAKTLGVAAGSGLPNDPAPAVTKVLVEGRALGSGDRIDIEWRYDEPTPGQYTWGPHISAVIAQFVSTRTPMVAIIDNAPPWASDGQNCDVALCGPNRAHITSYGNFCGHVARYLLTRGVVRLSIEVQNEENSEDSLAPGPNPGLFALSLHACYTAVKHVSPSIPVILGGLSPGPSGAEIPWMSPYAYLRDVLVAERGQRDFDAVGLHVSGNGLAQAQGVHQLLVSAGFPQVPIDITELDVQPNLTLGYIQAVLSQWQHLPWLGSLYIYAPPYARTSPLFAPDGQPTAQLADLLNEYRQVRTSGR